MWMENESRRLIIWLSGLKPLFCKISMKWMVLVNWLRKKKMSTSCKRVMCSRLWGWGVKGGRGKAQFRRQLTFRGFNYVVVCRYSSLFAALHYPAGRVNDILSGEMNERVQKKHGPWGSVGWLHPVRQNRETIACQQWPSDYWQKPFGYLSVIDLKEPGQEPGVKNRVKNRGLRTGSCLVGSTRRTSNTLLRG
jgi:hypothetical protein